MDSNQALDKARDKAFAMIERVETGEMGAQEADAIARGCYSVVKGEEVRLNHRLMAARPHSTLVAA